MAAWCLTDIKVQYLLRPRCIFRSTDAKVGIKQDRKNQNELDLNFSHGSVFEFSDNGTKTLSALNTTQFNMFT